MGFLAASFRWRCASAFICGVSAFAQQAPADSAVPPAPINVAPAAPTGIPDPSWSVRRNVFLKRLVSPQAVFETVPGATFDQVRNFPKEWGRSFSGFGKRNGSQYGQFAVGEAIEFGVSAFHREDPRYFRMPDAPMGQRIRNAIISGVWVRSADGTHKTLAVARLSNVYGSWAIATMWNPPSQRDFGRIMLYGSLGLGIKTSTNFFREFWPDVKQRVFHR